MITNDSIWGNIRDRTDNDVWDTVGHGAPVSGVGGTGAGICGPGSTYIDLTAVIKYTNTGSKSSPTWVNRETGSGGGGPVTPAGPLQFNAGTFNAGGSSQSDATPITTPSPATVVLLGGNNINGCRLPPAVAGNVFMICMSDDQNEGTTMYLYPSVGNSINKLPLNQAVQLYSVKGYVFTCAIGGEWRSIPIP